MHINLNVPIILIGKTEKYLFFSCLVFLYININNYLNVYKNIVYLSISVARIQVNIDIPD